MKDQELDQSKPILLGNQLLYPVNNKIVEIFENSDSTAQLMIKDNHFVIWGPKVVALGPNHEDHPKQESQLE